MPSHSGWPAAPEGVHRQNPEGARESGQGAHGQVDAAGDDDEGHAQGDDAGVGNLPQDVEEVLGLEEVGTQGRRDDDEDGEGDEAAVALGAECSSRSLRLAMA